MSNPLPPWPEGPDFHPSPLVRFESESAYYEALSAALRARLCAAKDALLDIRMAHPLMHNGGNWPSFVDEVLTLIGEIPND